MERFTSAIRKCLDSQNWYGALFIALAMPDICGIIEYPHLKKGTKSIKCYKHWFDTYLSKYYTRDINGKHVVFMTASDCYALRCSLIHMGIDDVSMQPAREIISRFAFVEGSANEFHCVKFKDLLVLKVAIFCEDVIKAINEWNENIKRDDIKQKQIESLLTILKGEIMTHPPKIVINGESA
jgi:hypothetical protein